MIRKFIYFFSILLVFLERRRLVQCGSPKTCIVNAYCQFSQQAHTNFMQTYLHCYKAAFCSGINCQKNLHIPIIVKQNKAMEAWVLYFTRISLTWPNRMGMARMKADSQVSRMVFLALLMVHKYCALSGCTMT